MTTEPTEPAVDVEPEPIVPEVPPRQTQPATSVYFKISRALDGSDFWIARLGMAFEVFGIECTRANQVAITKEVVGYIDCTEDGAVYTDRVTDDMIDTALVNLSAS